MDIEIEIEPAETTQGKIESQRKDSNHPDSYSNHRYRDQFDDDVELMYDDETPQQRAQSDIELNSNISMTEDNGEDLTNDLIIDEVIQSETMLSSHSNMANDPKIINTAIAHGGADELDDEFLEFEEPGSNDNTANESAISEVQESATINVVSSTAKDYVLSDSELEYESDEVSIEPQGPAYTDEATSHNNEEGQTRTSDHNNEDNAEPDTSNLSPQETSSNEYDERIDSLLSESDIDEEAIDEKEEKYYDERINRDLDDDATAEPATADFSEDELDDYQEDVIKENIEDHAKEKEEMGTEAIIELSTQIPIYIDLGENVYKLFTPTVEEEEDFQELPVLFNTNPHILSHTMGSFFGKVRRFLVDNKLTFSINDELTLIFKNLHNLTIKEDNLFSNKIELNDLISLFSKLKSNCENQDLFKFAQFEITTTPRFITQFYQLHECLNEGKGLEDIEREGIKIDQTNDVTETGKRMIYDLRNTKQLGAETSQEDGEHTLKRARII